MNPLITQQLRQVHGFIEELRETIDSYQGDLKEKKQAYIGLTQEYWSRGSKIAVLDQNTKEFQDLSEENERLRNQNAEFRQHLERILTYTKALIETFRSS